MAQVNATCIPAICVPVKQPPVPSYLLSDFPDVVSVSPGGLIQIDLLIRTDYYWKVMTGKFKHLAPGLVAQKSVLGWVISGSIPSKNRKKDQIGNLVTCRLSAIESHRLRLRLRLSATRYTVEDIQSTVELKFLDSLSKCFFGFFFLWRST